MARVPHQAQHLQHHSNAQATPTDFDDDMQLEYATVLISWLSCEGALPRQITPRQRKRANAKTKQQQPPIQVGEGEWGGAQAQPQMLQLEDDDAFPKLVEQETRRELLPPVPLTPPAMDRRLPKQLPQCVTPRDLHAMSVALQSTLNANEQRMHYEKMASY
eukprot:1157360-Pelagomonas_calceolata.AAC.10